MMTKTAFFELLKSIRANVTAGVWIDLRPNGKTALTIRQDGAPNAFISMHRDGSASLDKAFKAYCKWVHEFAVKFDDVIEADHIEALEMDAALSAPVAGERVYNTLKGEALQDWLCIAIRRDADGRATVETRSRFHVGGPSVLPNTWGDDYSDAEILHDDILLRHVYQRYGRDVFTSINTREFN